MFVYFEKVVNPADDRAFLRVSRILKAPVPAPTYDALKQVKAPTKINTNRRFILPPDPYPDSTKHLVSFFNPPPLPPSFISLSLVNLFTRKFAIQ